MSDKNVSTISLLSAQNPVVFIDTSKEVKNAIAGLAKEGLKAGAKVVKKHLRENLPIRSNRLKNHITHWVKIDRKTGQPECQIGFKSWQKVRKSGKKPSHASPWWIEYGTKPHAIPKNLTANSKPLFDKSKGIFYGWQIQHPGQKDLHVLRNTIESNIAEIRAAEEQYLALISGEIEKAQAAITDEDDEGDD